MGLTFEPLGKYVRLVDERNTNMVTESVLGINIDKYFMPSVANVIGTDLSNYKLLRKGRFACNPMHVGRDGRLPVSRYTEDVPAIVSPAYFMFEIIDENEIEPEYLMLCFLRPDFDRMCWFRTDASVRGGITWEDVCALTIPVPTISEQRKIVHDYQVITDRIELLRKMNENLEEIAYTHFEEVFASKYLENDLPDEWNYGVLGELCDVKGGKRLPPDCELTDMITTHPYIRVRDIGESRYVCLTDQFQYIDEETYEAISRYVVDTDDIVISIVGTIGLIGKVHCSLDRANLTENCVKLSNIKRVTPDYLYYTLLYKKQVKEIELLTVGAVQAKLPIYNIQNIKIVIPPKNIIDAFQKKFDTINAVVESNTEEIEKLKSLRNAFFSVISKGA